MLFDYSLKTRTHEAQQQVWDIARRKWVALTPEELIRQLLLHHLVETKGVAVGRIAVEREIDYYDLKKRFDLMVFDQSGLPFLLCECKRPDVKLSQDALYQLARYNDTLQAPHLLLTNGHGLLFFSLRPDGHYEFQESGWYEE